MSTVQDALAAPFNEGLARHMLRLQSCGDCGQAQTLTRYACTRCGSPRLVWQDACGLGTVYAVTVVSRAPSEDFRALTPYTLVLVTLDEGARLMAHAVAGVRIGQRVTATFFPHQDRMLVRFAPERA